MNTNQEGVNSQQLIWIFATDQIPHDAIIPERLREIQRLWHEKAQAFGDIGLCAYGARFEFIFDGASYTMPPIPGWQGALSWEHCKDEIEAMLREAGATEIIYHWGMVD